MLCLTYFQMSGMPDTDVKTNDLSIYQSFGKTPVQSLGNSTGQKNWKSKPLAIWPCLAQRNSEQLVPGDWKLNLLEILFSLLDRNNSFFKSGNGWWVFKINLLSNIIIKAFIDELMNVRPVVRTITSLSRKAQYISVKFTHAIRCSMFFFKILSLVANSSYPYHYTVWLV
jgi:hypothetical protein